MGQSRDQIRILESQLLQGELTPDEFEALRDEALSSGDLADLSPESQVIPTIFNEEDSDELEIAAGPEGSPPPEIGSRPRLEHPNDISTLMTPPSDAFDEEEPTDPDSARSPDEIEDFTLSMILETQGDLAFDPDLMLADVLAELEDDEDAVISKKTTPKKASRIGTSIRALIEEFPAALRLLFASTAVVCLLLLSLGGLISSMGADEFGCLVAKRADTVGVWRLYYENLPVGQCSDRAKEVLRAAGLMEPPPQAPVDASHHEDSADAHQEESAEHGVPGETAVLTQFHPLENPHTRPVLSATPQIVDDPTVPGTRSPDDTAEGQVPAQALSEVDDPDIKSCSEGKKINSVDGWRDYLEHFPTGRCATRATHFLNTRAPTSRSEGGVLEQRSTNKGPSDFLVDTIVLNDAAVRRCVRVARGRGREVPTQMGIHFTIESSGDVSGSRLVAPHLSGTSLDSCISEQVNLLHFPPWDGRDRTITYTLDLRRKATLPRRRPSPVQEATPDPHEEEEHPEAEEDAEAPAGGGGGH